MQLPPFKHGKLEHESTKWWKLIQFNLIGFLVITLLNTFTFLTIETKITLNTIALVIRIFGTWFTVASIFAWIVKANIGLINKPDLVININQNKQVFFSFEITFFAVQTTVAF